MCRFLPNFARLGSWNVAMFVTVEQASLELTQNCCSSHHSHVN